MYRIRMARNGYFYVQERVGPYNWTRVSPFYWTRERAAAFVRRNTPGCRCNRCTCH